MKKFVNNIKTLINYPSILIIIMLCFSCKNESKHKVFIEKISTIQNGLPSPYFNYYLYLKTDSGKILEANVDSIYEIYKSYYSHKYNNFNNYLLSVIDGKDLVKENYINTVKKKGDYLLNVNDVDKDISEMTVDEIEKKYLNLERQSFVLVTGNLTATETRNILYKMFFEGYIISFSDYGGYYFIKKYNDEDLR